MTLSNALIGELRVILREEYGKEVSDAEASEIGKNLVRYFSLLAKVAHRTGGIPGAGESVKPEEPP